MRNQYYKRGDLVVYLVIAIVLLFLSGCDKDNSPLNPVDENDLLPPKLYAALDLVKNDYDFTWVTIRVGVIENGDKGQIYGAKALLGIDTILVNGNALNMGSEKDWACYLVHELTHLNRADTNEQAAIAEQQVCINLLRSRA